MKITRRNFLGFGSSAIAIATGLFSSSGASLVSAQKVAAAGTGSNFDAIGELNKLDFENQIGTFFAFGSGIGKMGGTLVDVRDVLQLGSEKGRIYHTQGFSLLFEPTKGMILEQDVHRVTHKSLGTFYLLMTPVRYSQDNPKLVMEAIINRFV